MKNKKLLISLAGLSLSVMALAVCTWPIAPYYYGGSGCSWAGFCTEPTFEPGGCEYEHAENQCVQGGTYQYQVPHYGTRDGGFFCSTSDPCVQKGFTNETANASSWVNGSTCDDGMCGVPPPHAIPYPDPVPCPVGGGS